VIGHLFGAVVRDIGNNDTELRGSLEINIIYPNAIPGTTLHWGSCSRTARVICAYWVISHRLPADTDNVFFFFGLSAD